MKTFTDTTPSELRDMGIGVEYSPPSISPNHIDGPMLRFSDGQLHWLTLLERVQYRLGWTDARKLQLKLRPRWSDARLDF